MDQSVWYKTATSIVSEILEVPDGPFDFVSNLREVGGTAPEKAVGKIRGS